MRNGFWGWVRKRTQKQLLIASSLSCIVFVTLYLMLKNVIVYKLMWGSVVILIAVIAIPAYRGVRTEVKEGSIELGYRVYQKEEGVQDG